MSLVADSFHMLGDIAALLISFLSVKVSCAIVQCFVGNFSHDQLSLDVTEEVEPKHFRMGTS